MSVARFKDVDLCSSGDKVSPNHKHNEKNSRFVQFSIAFVQNYPATNLLSDSNEKWQVDDASLESAYVVLELENPTQINGIEIGSENSTSIEVSVGQRGMDIENYTVLTMHATTVLHIEQPFYYLVYFQAILMASSFNENPNQVRSFAKDALMTGVVNKK